ncbi:MAG: DUF5721 family protein [Clostridiales bacterium]|jgi:hypothetical protein|nr:DUF5721 family protein [Clostridiales bacterium]
MLAFELTGAAMSSFMKLWLAGAAFDSYFVKDMEIVALTRFQIAGNLEKAYVAEEGKEPPARNYCFWSEIKPYAFGLIRGTKKPKLIKVVLLANDDLTKEMHENAASLSLNISCDEERAVFTTGTMQKSFSMDKSMNHIWDEYVERFFKSLGFPVSTLS